MLRKAWVCLNINMIESDFIFFLKLFGFVFICIIIILGRMQLPDKSWDWGLGEIENHIYLHIFHASLQSSITRFLGTGHIRGWYHCLAQ